MQIRKNTKAFKTILEIFTSCRDRVGREDLIRLYITKAGDSIRDRISVEAMGDQAGVFYELNYDAVLTKLQSPNHQLHQSDEIPGVYFFHSTSNKAWDETPFEFDEAVTREFATLANLPVTRKKEKVEKFVFAAAKAQPNDKTKATTTKKAKDKAVRNKVESGPKQPDYDIQQEIHFTNLGKVVFRQGQVSKRDVLDYYDKIAEYILPYLKDRPIVLRLQQNSGRDAEYARLDALAETMDLPAWIERPRGAKGKLTSDVLLCNDKEHLLFYVEAGAVSFSAIHSRVKSIKSPDCIIVGIESPDADIRKAIDVALATKEVLSGLKLPSFVKTDGMSSLHIYVPLDSKSDFEIGRAMAEYLCKLIRLKLPDMVTFKGTENYHYGKVSLDYQINGAINPVIAPYSLILGESAIVATPLQWEEVNHGLQFEALNHATMLKRLKQAGDPFEDLFNRKTNARDVLRHMEQNYSFLL